jgi:hypothetical protein
MDDDLRTKLLELRERDCAKRQELIERRELFTGYHAEMERVHRSNARALEEILEFGGWPKLSHVGEDGAEAAWLVVTHAIAEPAFQRRCVDLLGRGVKEGEANPALWAALVDRIRFNERKPQVYGTIFDWDQDERLSPWLIEEPECVEERRRELGLPPLEESIRETRERAAREGARAPKAFAERQAEIIAWARRVGWIVE